MASTPLVSASRVETLPLSEMKQQFSLAFVHMVVSAAGCSVKYHSTDYDGVDITIASSAEYESHYCPQFEIQVKCTAQTDLKTDSTMRWELEAKPFQKLTHPKSYVERFLGVLVVPGDSADWLNQDEAGLLTKSVMYWEHASKLGAIPDGQKTKVVHLPRSNTLNVAQLQNIMKKIGEGGEW
jgi:hypothetical protein